MNLNREKGSNLGETTPLKSPSRMIPGWYISITEAF